MLSIVFVDFKFQNQIRLEIKERGLPDRAGASAIFVTAQIVITLSIFNDMALPPIPPNNRAASRKPSSAPPGGLPVPSQAVNASDHTHLDSEPAEKRQGAQKKKLPSAVKSAPVQPKTPARTKPSAKAVKSPYNTVKEGDIDLGDGWFRDKKTGKDFRAIPTLKDEARGDALNPVAENIENSLYDFNSSAGDFLAHLQVPPSPKQMQKIQAARQKRERMILEKYDRKWQDTEEEEEAPEKESGLFSSIFQRITGKS